MFALCEKVPHSSPVTMLYISTSFVLIQNKNLMENVNKYISSKKTPYFESSVNTAGCLSMEPPRGCEALQMELEKGDGDELTMIWLG